MKYVNGEEVTAARIQNEPWYSDYQEMMEIHVFQEVKSVEDVLKRFEEENSMYVKITPEMHARFERWAKAVCNPEGGCCEIMDE